MPEISPSKYLVTAGWDNVPHLDEKTKSELLAATPEYLRAARSEGTPSLGAGAIYPFDWNMITVDPFPIPRHWRKGYGLDVGWNRTAGLWMAEDPDTMQRYAYAEHYMGQALPLVHAEAIKARGEWIKGAIDPASRGRAQGEGTKLIDVYQGHGLHLEMAVNAVEAGLYAVWEAISIGRLKFFTTLQQTKQEISLYRRDEHGKVVKKNDHLMDALRYAFMTYEQVGRPRPADKTTFQASTGAADKRAGY